MNFPEGRAAEAQSEYGIVQPLTGCCNSCSRNARGGYSRRDNM